MRCCGAIPLLLLVACAAPATQRRPVAVLYVDEPWSRGDVASASPLLALYDDGLVIYQDDLVYQDDLGVVAPRYVRAVLDARERADLERTLTPELFGLEESWSLFEMPHQPYNVLHLWRDGRRRTIMVYGDLSSGSDLRDKCPPAFRSAFDALAGFRLERATPWHPGTVLVSFSEQEVGETARPWPRDWPGLSDAARGPSGRSVIELDYRHLPHLRALWRNGRDSHAPVVIDGRRGLVTYWLPLPRHELWDAWPDDTAQAAGAR